MEENLSLLLSLKNRYWDRKWLLVYKKMKSLWHSATGDDAIKKSKKDNPKLYKMNKKELKLYRRQWERDNYDKRYADKKWKINERQKARRILQNRLWRKLKSWETADHIKPLALWWKTTSWNIRLLSHKDNSSWWSKVKQIIKKMSLNKNKKNKKI